MAWNDEQRARARELWRKGFTGDQIACDLHKSRGSVLGQLWRMGEMGNRSKAQKRQGPPPGAFGMALGKKPKNRSEGIVKRPTFATEPLPEEDASEVPTKTLDELELNDRCCRFRIDKPIRNEPYGFCGKKTVIGLSWCEAHAARCFGNWVELAHRHVSQKETVDG